MISCAFKYRANYVQVYNLSRILYIMDAIVDNIYVVNMKKDVDRLHRFQLQCKSIFSYEIIEGVDVQTDEYITFYNEWMKTNNSNITYENFNWRYYID